MANATTVRLGDAEVPVVAQSGPYLAKLEKDLPEVFASLGGEDFEVSGLLSLGWDTLYTLTSKLIPKMTGPIPRYRWNGYSTRELFEDPEAEPDLDLSEDGGQVPTHAQVVTALETAVKVNRLDIYGSLGKMLGGLDLEKVADSLPSRSLPSTNGESPSRTPSGTAPTSTPNGV